jgi:mannose-1-phosphate guanylyltransferase/phosphomannomutase
VQQSVVNENSYIGAGARVEGAAVGRACDLRQGARVEPGAVLGEGCFVGANAELKAGVKVYPFKTVETGAMVNSSIVWESGGSRLLFGRNGVQGIANVDISPELALRLSMAWASTLEKGSVITASRDTSRIARVLKRAIMVGCNAAGVTVQDLEVATVPVTRHHARISGSQGAVTVRLLADDPQSVVIRFFDRQGIDLPESGQRKVERLYHREEFRRVLANEMGDISFPVREVEQYTADLVDTVDLSHARDAGMKLVLDVSFGTASFVMPNLLSKLGADVLVVNPYAQTGSAMSVDRAASAERVADLVRAAGAHLGAVIDQDCETLTIVDDEGRVLSDDQALLLLLRLVIDTDPDARVALPVAAPAAAERMCREADVPLVWTKLSSTNLMETAAQGGVTFAASQSGGFLFPRFIPAYDAAATLVELVSLLSVTGQTLSKLVQQLPPVHIVHESVVTPWEQKGMLMRTLVEQLGDRDLVLVDGVKAPEGDGWVLTVPDPEEPVTHVWAEGPSEASARALAQQYGVRLRQLLR